MTSSEAFLPPSPRADDAPSAPDAQTAPSPSDALAAPSLSDALAAPSLSVIVCCRNSAATLAETLDALVDQKYDGRWELVIVDNGSTDGTAAVARRYVGRVDHVVVLHPPRTGCQALGLNYGIAHSRGEFLIFVDSDDLPAPGYLTEMASALRDAPLVGGVVEVERLNAPWTLARRRMLQVERVDLFCNYLPAVIGAAMGARREAVEAVGGFDETLLTQHDLDLSWRLFRAGYAASFAPGAVLHYRYRETLASTFAQEIGYGEGEVALYRKFAGSGLRRRGALRVLADYARMVVALRGLGSRAGRARWVTLAGANLGRIKGSIRQRTLYL